ncbi:MAG: YdiU family protein [Rubellimicrobium sp.]|nr:YdiU family protein [Rubellimicrobium sp.]
MTYPRFDNSYARLPGHLFARVLPEPVAAPRLVVLNVDLARAIGCDPGMLGTQEGLGWLSGNAVPPGAEPLAAAYAGHQFGVWSPQLGDGRAVLLGEILGPDGARRDLGLKGSGRTPWSRGGDGRAWIGPVLREYLLSEAMHALGVPTTRALAVVLTGEEVMRDGPRPGAILTRVAASHIRIGTFQYLAARRDREGLAALVRHAIDRHWPGVAGAEGLLRAVVAAQARLVAQWMAVGFVHGVMNTDNMTVSGETIDYGPCAFLDGYDPGAVFSSIDRHGRYAWGNQPAIALWNLAQFASALIVLEEDAEEAVARMGAVLRGFGPLFEAERDARLAARIGLPPGDEARALVEELLALMAAGGSDFTATFTALGEGGARDRIADRAGHDAWEARWRRAGPDAALMARSNPRVIPRNHLIEAAISRAVAGDFAPFHAMLAAVTRPFSPDPLHERPPGPGERVTQTFCGT